MPEQMNWLQVILLVICIALVVIPPKYDPSIRWKERNEEKKRNRK